LRHELPLRRTDAHARCSPVTLRWKKLIGFVSSKLGVPGVEGRSAFFDLSVHTSCTRRHL